MQQSSSNQKINYFNPTFLIHLHLHPGDALGPNGKWSYLHGELAYNIFRLEYSSSKVCSSVHWTFLQKTSGQGLIPTVMMTCAALPRPPPSLPHPGQPSQALWKYRNSEGTPQQYSDWSITLNGHVSAKHQALLIPGNPKKNETDPLLAQYVWLTGVFTKWWQL